MQRPSLALSQPLLSWLQQDPSWRLQPAGLRWRCRWLAALGSLNARLSASLERSTVVTLDDPVLVVGPWRSGTTVMHELLTAATGCAAPRTWQCMDPCAFRLGRSNRTPVAIARPMDGLEIRADSPQEDEFALLALGVDSAYRAFWLPHRLGELGHTLDPAHWLAHPQWLAPWEAFLRGVLAASGGDGTQPLLLKSPNHTYRIRSILQRFPKARLVWMARDATPVAMSNRKMWTTMFETHGTSQPRPGALDSFLRLAIDAAAQALHWCVDQLPADRLVVVAHEDLIAHPAATVEATIQRLALPRARDSSRLPMAIASVRGGRVERHTAALPRDLAPPVRALDETQQWALRSHAPAKPMKLHREPHSRA